MTFRRVLVTTDGTDASLRGVEMAAQIVVSCHAELVLLTAVSVPQQVVLAAAMDERAIAEYIEHMAQEALNPAVALLKSKAVGAEAKAVFGVPSQVILAEIEASRADLVVMGRATRTEPQDIVLGSISVRIANHVKVPILLVP